MQNKYITLNFKIPAFAAKVLEKSGYLPLQDKSIEQFVIFSLLATNNSSNINYPRNKSKKTLPLQSISIEIPLPANTTIIYNENKLRVIILHLTKIAKTILFNELERQVQKKHLLTDSVREIVAYYDISEDDYPESSILHFYYHEKKKES